MAATGNPGSRRGASRRWWPERTGRAFSNAEFVVGFLVTILVCALVAAVFATAGIPYWIFAVVALIICALFLAVLFRGRRTR